MKLSIYTCEVVQILSERRDAPEPEVVALRKEDDVNEADRVQHLHNRRTPEQIKQ